MMCFRQYILSVNISSKVNTRYPFRFPSLQQVKAVKLVSDSINCLLFLPNVPVGSSVVSVT
jgi:hypothetical protein